MFLFVQVPCNKICKETYVFLKILVKFKQSHDGKSSERTEYGST